MDRKLERDVSRIIAEVEQSELHIAGSVQSRVAKLNWSALDQSLCAYGYAQTPAILTPAECRSLVQLYSDDHLFRSRIEMARFRFGEGDYKYFAAPLPAIVQELRTAYYSHVAPIANRWME